mmetsp:Transcript_41725/g.106192  ORF Transcript_41725/g.106192 Transcript_41725/m.106192 type:complete len:98 (-) Transcript_41725:609-902(-)
MASATTPPSRMTPRRPSPTRTACGNTDGKCDDTAEQDDTMLTLTDLGSARSIGSGGGGGAHFDDLASITLKSRGGGGRSDVQHTWRAVDSWKTWMTT